MRLHADTLAAQRAMHIGGAGLTVRELGRATRFYSEAIGLRVFATSPGRTLLGAGDAAFLELIAAPDAAPDDPRQAGLFHVAFLLPRRADLADWLAHAKATGVAIDGASDHGVSEAIYLSDPEGNGIEIYADRPRADWHWSGTRIRMTTERLDARALLATRSAEGWRGAPAGTRIGHVHLRVGSVTDAARFWTETVGLDLVCALPQAAFLSSGGYHHHIGANTWSSQGAGPRDPGRAGLAYVALDGAAERGPIADPWGTEIRFGVTAGLGEPGFKEH